jgi:hypothetical protein
MLADPCRPTAIFCVNDLTALGILRGLCRRGLSVPEDIALVGYDDVEFVGLLASRAGWRLAIIPFGQTAHGSRCRRASLDGPSADCYLEVTENKIVFHI